MIRRSVENAVALLQKSGPQFVKVSGCVSCHHQTLPVIAFGVAREHGVPIDETAAQAASNALTRGPPRNSSPCHDGHHSSSRTQRHR